MVLGLVVTAVSAAIVGASDTLLTDDLTGLGPILLGAPIALIVGGSTLYWITTYAGVPVFAGLTAYDMQKLTQYGQAVGGEGRGAIQGALTLYLDFINLFLFLLRIFGSQR